MKVYSRPYPEPEARTFKQWCDDLGLEAQPETLIENVLTYDEYCSMPGVTFRKTKEGTLYDWWRKYGGKWGEDRTIEEWIIDFNWDINELEKNDLKDLNLFLGHDEFWEWSSGKLSMRQKREPGLLGWIKGLFT